MKNLKKYIALLIVAFAAMFTLTGCGSSINDYALQQTIRKLAKYKTRDLGTDIQLKYVKHHARFLFMDTLGKILGSANMQGDEVWLVEISSSKWKSKEVRVHRRGSHYWLEYLEE